MGIGCARVSTGSQDLERQLEALVEAGVAPERLVLDKRSGTTTARPPEQLSVVSTAAPPPSPVLEATGGHGLHR